MNYPISKLIWIPFVLGGCDLIFPPCTNFKREVCACDDAGKMMCELAEAAEEKAQEYKDNDDDDRYESAQDACETLLEAWDEADGCEQFAEGGGEEESEDESGDDGDDASSDGGGSDGSGSDGGGSDGSGSDGGGSDGGGSDGGGGNDGGGDGGGDDGGGSASTDAMLYCSGECAYSVACWELNEATCLTDCLDLNAEAGLCDGPDSADWAVCATEAAMDCDEDALTACFDNHYRFLDICE